MQTAQNKGREVIRKTSTVRSFDKLMAKLIGRKSNSCYSCGFSVFRGDTDISYGLVPSVGRNAETLRREVEIFEDYRRYAASHGDDIGALEAYDQLASAQHNGVPTRLLDWSLSPLVAAYFATLPTIDGANNIAPTATDAVIYILHSCVKVDTYLEGNPFEVSNVRLFHPSDIRSRRILAQQGVFSVQPNPSNDLSNEISEEDDENDLWIDRIVISKEAVEDVRDKVSFLGFSARTLFPDTMGLGQSLRLHPRNGHQIINCEPYEE